MTRFQQEICDQITCTSICERASVTHSFCDIVRVVLAIMPASATVLYKAYSGVLNFGNVPCCIQNLLLCRKVLAMCAPVTVYKAGKSNFLLPLPNLAKSILHNFSLLKKNVYSNYLTDTAPYHAIFFCCCYEADNDLPIISK